MNSDCNATHPSIGVDGLSTKLHVSGCVRVVTLPEPHLDEVVGPFHGIEASAVGVEWRPVVVRSGRLHTTPCVAGSRDVTNIPGWVSSLGTACRHVAVGRSVQSHSIGALIVNTFHPTHALSVKA